MATINNAPFFGIGDGKVTTSINGNDYGQSVIVLTDGKILVAGYSGIGSDDYDFALARYHSDGSLDTTFSSDGKLTTDFGSDDRGRGIIVYKQTARSWWQGPAETAQATSRWYATTRTVR
jgi:hypothetical protein